MAAAAAGGGSPESAERRRQRRLLGALGPFEPLLSHGQALLVWERPLHSLGLHLAANLGFWFLALTSLRLVFLLAVGLIAAVCADACRGRAWPRVPAGRLRLGALELLGFARRAPPVTQVEEDSDTESWGLVHPKMISLPELCQRMAAFSVRAEQFLKNLYLFKKQNPGQFCLLVCGVFTILAVVGRYIPGILLCYVTLLTGLLWPLVLYHQLPNKLHARVEPLLKRLDFSVRGYVASRQRERLSRRRTSAARAADDGSDSDGELAAFCPKFDDSTFGRELEISDLEHSDAEVSYTENGTFNLSRGQTPMTDGSEDLDRHSDPEESFARDLPEFPSINPDAPGLDDDEDTSLGLPSSSWQPVPEDGASLSSEQEEVEDDLPSPPSPAGRRGFSLADAVAAEALGAAAQAWRGLGGREPDTDAEGDDFELLDQSELSQLESPGPRPPAKPGFLSHLLRKQ